MNSTTVKRIADDLGFALCGVCDARPTDFADAFRGWLAAGKQGEMDWLARNVEVRLDPRKLVDEAKSIVVVADALSNTSRGRPPADDAARASSTGAAVRFPALPLRARGRVARYAHVSDYHKVMKKRLFKLADALRDQHPQHIFRVCVDTAPLLEREHAQRAGIGWTGKHTLTLNRDRGSHLLLGAIVTTLHLQPDEPATDHCGTCTRCIDACPTDAITPHSVDATRCISYLTIEHRSAIPREFHEAIGDWIYGCDICQDICPFVRRAEERIHHGDTEGTEGDSDSPTSRGRQPADASVTTSHDSTAGDAEAAPSPGPSLAGRGDADPPPGYDWKFATLDIAEVLAWTEEDRREAFRGSAMKRAKLPMMKRNALIVAGNRLRQADDPELRGKLERLADADENEMVRRTAREVLASVGR